MIYVGLDVSKHKIDVFAALSKPLSFFVSNDLSGVADLLGRLSPVHSYHFVCEYTGIYYLLFASALVDAGYPVSVCNPVQIANFARMRMVRTKTDKKDAELIALFGRMTQPGCWVPPGVDVFKLRSCICALSS